MDRKKKLTRNFIMQFGLFLLLIIIDQATKIIAAANLKGNEDINIIDNILTFHYLENTGAAFGIFQNSQWLFFVFAFVIFIIIILLMVVIYRKMTRYCELDDSLFKQRTYSNMIALNYILSVLGAGAIGNLIDRIAYGHVIDYIYVKLIDFPVFNFADICVTLSAAALVVFFIFFYKEDENMRIFGKTDN